MPIFKLIRSFTKPIILAAERCCNPRVMQRDSEVQKKIDTQTGNMAIYQYLGCPFCMMTRRAIRRLNLNIELRDALHDHAHKTALIEDGGKSQVPCLYIQEKGEDIWMYESAAIIDYLEKRFGDKRFEEAA